MKRLALIALAGSIGCGASKAEAPVAVAAAPIATSFHSSGALPACSTAVAAAIEDSQRRRVNSDTSHDSEIAGALNHGDYVKRCAVPDSAGVEVCTAIRLGQVRGITVTLDGGNQAIADCIAKSVAAMSFPSTGDMVETKTRFLPLGSSK